MNLKNKCQVSHLHIKYNRIKYEMGLHVEKYHVVIWSTQSTTQKQTILLKVFVLFLGNKPMERESRKAIINTIAKSWKAIINGAPHWWRKPNPMVQQLHIEEYKQKPNFMRKHSLELNLFALPLFFLFFLFLWQAYSFAGDSKWM